MTDNEKEMDPKALEGSEEDLMKKLSDGKGMPDGITPVTEISQAADPIEGSPA